MQHKKRVLLVHRFFYPDSPPYALILNDIRKSLLKEGYSVDVLSSQPSYKSIDLHKTEKIISKEGDSIIYRLPVFKFKSKKLRNLLNFIWFPFIIFFFLLLKRRYDIITVATTPPVLLAFVVACISKVKNTLLVYHFMDIHPEIGRLSGEFNNKYIYSLLSKMDLFSCKVASKIIVLSNDMKNALLVRDKSLEKKIEIINNYDLGCYENKTETYFKTKKKRIVYAGNIGRFQGLELFLTALKTIKQRNEFELIFVGEGNALESLKEKANEYENVSFIPHVSISEVRQIISDADMGIVSLEKEIIKYAYPSKVMTYLSEGTPILVVADKGTEIENFVKDNNIGIFIESEDTSKLIETYQNFINDKIVFDKEHIKKVFNQNYKQLIFERKLIKVFNDLSNEGALNE